MPKEITFNHDKKYDIQLAQGMAAERRFAKILGYAKIEKIEVKKEEYLWEKSECIAIEYLRNGKPSGITSTEADFWVHELRRKNETICHIMISVKRLKEIAKKYFYIDGHRKERAGDYGLSSLVLIPLFEFFK